MNSAVDIKAGQYVVFTIIDKLCALSIDEVIEIIQIQSITNVPGVKEYIPGMINLRGSIIPVVDLHKRFRLPDIAFTKKTRMIIVQSDGEEIGLIVDEVVMVVDVHEADLEGTIEMFNSLEKECYLGFAKIEEQLIGIFNLQTVLYPNYEEVLQIE